MNLNNETYKKQIIPLIIYLFISFFFVAISSVHFFDPIYFFSDKATGGIRVGLYATGVNIHNYLAFFTNAKSLVDENQSLKKKLYDYDSLKSENQTLLSENVTLRSQIGTNSNIHVRSLLSEIISRSATLDYITINQGSSEGVAKDDVVVYKNILIGIVKDVNPTSSKVELITDKDSLVPVQIAGSSINGIGSGSIELGLVMNNILPGLTIPLNQDVVTSGLGGGVYPSGLLLGTVSNVMPISSQPFQTAVIKPALDISQLSYVFVLQTAS